MSLRSSGLRADLESEMARRKSKQPKTKVPASLDRNPPVGHRPLTGQALVDAMQASPHRDIDIEPERAPMPVRDVTL
jgi:hypothetical protein